MQHEPVEEAAFDVRRVDGSKCLLAMILLSAAGNSVLVIQPLTVGAMVDTMGFSDRQAGLVASAELAGFSLGSLLMSFIVHRFNRHHIAYLGTFLLVVGNVLATIPEEFLPFVLCRSVAGFGCAMPIASLIGTAVLTRAPDRTFGVVNATSIAYSGILLFISPALIQSGGLTMIYAGMAAIAALIALAVHWIPAKPWTTAMRAEAGSTLEPAMPRVLGGATLPFMWASVLLVMLLLYAGHGAVWAYQERIGFSFGVDKTAIGNALGIAMMVGIAGSLLAWRVGLAIGRVWPQVISLGLSIVAALLLVSGSSLIEFSISSSLITFTWFYGLPYQMGLLARLDPGGRANVTGVFMTTGGSALGPAIAAGMISPGEFAAVGWFAGSCYAVCLVLVLAPAVMIGRWDKAVAAARRG